MLNALAFMQKCLTVLLCFFCFKVEVEKKWIETESQRQSGCMTQ